MRFSETSNNFFVISLMALAILYGCGSNGNYSLVIYSISYQLDGGQTTNDNPTSYDVTSATIIMNNPTKEGYTFTGWTGSNGNTPQPVAIIEKGSTGDKSSLLSYLYKTETC